LLQNFDFLATVIASGQHDVEIARGHERRQRELAAPAIWRRLI
jgi:hypothetical protein